MKTEKERLAEVYKAIQEKVESTDLLDMEIEAEETETQETENDEDNRQG